MFFSFFVRSGGPADKPNKPGKIKAEVIFMDGALQQIDHPVFVYNWVSAEDERYINAPWHTQESNDFHFLKVVRGVTIDKKVLRQNISRIALSWSAADADGLGPEHIVLTLRNGEQLSIQGRDFAATSAFLEGVPIEKVSAEAVFKTLELHGFATVEGQRGKFSARIACQMCVGLEKSEKIKEIHFLVTP